MKIDHRSCPVLNFWNNSIPFLKIQSNEVLYELDNKYITNPNISVITMETNMLLIIDPKLWQAQVNISNTSPAKRKCAITCKVYREIGIIVSIFFRRANAWGGIWFRTKVISNAQVVGVQKSRLLCINSNIAIKYTSMMLVIHMSIYLTLDWDYIIIKFDN